MEQFRADVARLIAEGDSMPTPKEIAQAVYDRFTHTVPADVWAAREKLLDVGQKIDPRTAFRQIWAYAKGIYKRTGQLINRVDTLTSELKGLRAEVAALKTQVGEFKCNGCGRGEAA